MAKRILFQEISDNSADFLHELNDPDLLRARSIPKSVTDQLRQQQARKLETNIATLRQKQIQFNQKMNDYVTGLQRLIGSLKAASGAADPSASGAADPFAAVAAGSFGKAATLEDPALVGGVRVHCQGCECERTFDHLRMLFARESDESIHQPTECYVTDCGTIKKGTFFCETCGAEMLTIRSP